MRDSGGGDRSDGGFGGAKRRDAGERAAEAARVSATEEGEVKRVVGLENRDDQGNSQNGHGCLAEPVWLSCELRCGVMRTNPVGFYPLYPLQSKPKGLREGFFLFFHSFLIKTKM